MKCLQKKWCIIKTKSSSSLPRDWLVGSTCKIISSTFNYEARQWVECLRMFLFLTSKPELTVQTRLNRINNICVWHSAPSVSVSYSQWLLRIRQRHFSIKILHWATERLNTQGDVWSLKESCWFWMYLSCSLVAMQTVGGYSWRGKGNTKIISAPMEEEKSG